MAFERRARRLLLRHATRFGSPPSPLMMLSEFDAAYAEFMLYFR